jgi:hypothetical protein
MRIILCKVVKRIESNRCQPDNLVLNTEGLDLNGRVRLWPRIELGDKIRWFFDWPGCLLGQRNLDVPPRAGCY